MPCTHGHRHSIFCVLPPYLLDAILRHGTQQQRDAAVRTKSVDHTFRSLRLSGLGAKAARRMTPSAAAVASPAVPVKRRTIFNANHTETLPGTLVRGEGQPASGDVTVDEAYDGLGATFDFFAEVYQRNSIDDGGMPLEATVHFGQDYNNAFWNSVQMVFGDGDGELFNRFTIALDVIGHELSHGVTEDEAQLQYFNQSGALNESMSDVFGSLIKQYHLQQTADQADWLIGAGLFTARVKGVALRSMKDPGSAYDDPVLGKDPQPKHMDQLVDTFDDNGGVHINSGIPNHAFYQVATRIGGFAWEQAGRIWYDALRDARVKPNANFLAFARVTLEVAGTLYGVTSTQRQAVKDGWAAVGIAL
ncbi:Thermolysin metallopeptidase, catalytic domain [Roseateles sp. YR242]|uniref:M4 family metallopeptidase n=1 Tax=Roseateles sp. YR242 TaxID=1855305 RepID=UPI0008C9D5F6|nr:M4 family metallopeptidase [Roseateles sp. YR242]SEK23780.1 Thermolysin metallopeptidase, catalytic domain [Roseateles sp. YR242]